MSSRSSYRARLLYVIPSPTVRGGRRLPPLSGHSHVAREPVMTVVLTAVMSSLATDRRVPVSPKALAVKVCLCALAVIACACDQSAPSASPQPASSQVTNINGGTTTDSEVDGTSDIAASAVSY